MVNVLFLVLHRKDRSPGQRYRFEQYLTHLEKNGVSCSFSPLLTKEEDTLFYSQKKYFRKLLIGIKAFNRRVNDLRRVGNFDCVYIFRDAFFFGSWLEKRIAKRAKYLVYDFDDAIWLHDENPNQGVFNKLKTPEKVSKFIGWSDQVIVGNTYLADYARQFNPNIEVIPSTIDMASYSISPNENRDKICIGWTGSFSTIKHFETVVPALEKIKEIFGLKIYFKVIGDPSYTHKTLGIQGVTWVSETEAKDLSELDIGIMPLPDNDWTRGKCAMKGLQYMALEIPTIMSPVGVNSDIIMDGENGFLAGSVEEWVDKLSMLIEDQELRGRLGVAGRKTVEEEYSVEANKDKWLAVFS